MAIVKQILPGVYANIIAGDRDAALSARAEPWQWRSTLIGVRR